ncbi:hypothetical protein RhiirC2_795672 [Rhizophagus irregularis]|uniref:Uncharacterized protein n=1 Tax=Rhizophagus irregularis TaxID=588596 RepID=A0A2N1MB45_9GLOM|nr:hypothetical protein RhiirC2_795672 [Rhizophagus irregularis]
MSDPGSEFGGINDPAIKALGWKADKPSNFAIKGNSKHITDSLGWYTDVPVTLKDKENKTVTVIGNFVRIDNGETEPMLFFVTWKTYIIPTFSKVLVVKDLPKEEQESSCEMLPSSQVSAISSNLTSEEDLKKSA